MNDRYRNKYRVPSARLPGWDYGRSGYYFITICTANREHLFGKIIGDKMVLSNIGIIVLQEWEKSFIIRGELYRDAFVIMPNHIHAILRIEKPEETDDGGGDCRDARPCVSTPCASTPCVSTTTTDDQTPRNGIAHRSPKSISSFVAGFKSAATKRINEFRHTPKLPVWQSRFHDHIIRDEKSYYRIKQYIVNNPALWQEDRYYA